MWWGAGQEATLDRDEDTFQTASLLRKRLTSGTW